MYKITICHLYPDLLNMYGDKGNVIVLKQRALWRNISVEIKKISIGDAFIPEDYDIVFIGGGQDYEQKIIQKDLILEKGTEIKNAINNDKVFLCICGGYQLLGKYYRTWEGEEIKFLGALDFWTIGSRERMVGNIVFECDFLKTDGFDGKIVGFENHSGRTYLGSGVSPLGKVIVGYGNNGEDKYEGAIYKNTFCSYSHGSLLSKNPWLADHLLKTALKQKYKDFNKLDRIDDNFETDAHDSMIKRLYPHS
ncbi:MAG TPA: glutamine amidotransferase [Clostridiaceae bacterium]|nr:glutamine amidotransferase [Clostridiaceae bacterium]